MNHEQKYGLRRIGLILSDLVFFFKRLYFLTRAHVGESAES